MDKRVVYMDYSATTPVKKEVLDEMLPYFGENFGNPSSLYAIGRDSQSAIGKARGQVAGLIGAFDREIYFTSSGTEADNWALIGAAQARQNKGRHIITTRIEHHAMLHTCEFLEKERGCEITWLEVDSTGKISLDALEKAIRPDTILISVMFANNEIGTIQPIRQIAEIAKAHGVLFHTDAVQALGNVPIDVQELGVDMMSVSAHKIYGPKGIGALYIRKGLVIPNFMHGGAQEKNKRAGTENLTGIVGFGKAAELAGQNLEGHISYVRQLRDYFLKEVLAKNEHVSVNGDLKDRLPGNLNLTFHYIEGEASLLFLDINGIYVSTGSACSSASFTPSHVLQALGLPLEDTLSALRFTVGDFTTKDDIDYVVEKVTEMVRKYRAFSPTYNDRKELPA
jgi:cysteine desulfurase